MTKAELAAKVSEKAGIARTKAEQAVNAVFETLTETFKAGESYTQTGFGSFSIQDRP